MNVGEIRTLNNISSELSEIDGDFIKKMFVVEEGLKKMEQVEIPRIHYFAKGLYAREIHVKKGNLIIGKMHKHSQINVVSQGVISVLTENGWVRMEAPYTFESPPGVKRAGFAHEDTVWTTFIATQETDVEKMDDLLTIGSYKEYLELKDTLLIKEKELCLT